ncbi:PREDICTED: arylsulfatase B-like isoform X2 [Amphimedon queenslandica]|uniref:Sulfatase N-terminal domain-containing protein n=1 Tax=Amphimedon queenslandica TaxID=400682 RepID=A0AAN0JH37_AMPQE|nr:PREDICTED: arylsulfatase B-like isoform X1 [Amphimedon queenslandica]XP_019856111.1 PREDICTED: arylsulfatase B-like isoform X2 [Amphimedon queenslandica]|eukprot:XP_019856107.1 PREDICTED: arylsulfatase B-like isoform X1 [Amphimedon queenslandica]
MLAVLAVGVFLLGLASGASPNANLPHIVMMLVDDWGWANVGYHRNPPTCEVVTPNIDKLVKEGLELNQHYVYKFCSPSRSSLISGRLPIHVNDQNLLPTNYNPDDPVSGFSAIPRNMTGIAEKMRGAGYATHQVGKWDAGMATSDHTPKGRGFQTSFGYFHHANDYYKETASACNRTQIVDLWETDKPAHGINGTGPDNYEEGLFKERVLDVVSNHDPSTPLFLYYAPHIVHTPLQVPDRYLKLFSFINDHDRQYYHAMVNYLDDVVGEITDALKNKGMWDNLLFVTSSDNGGPVYPGGGANNYPLRGGKVTDWQGGVRVNAFVSGGYLPEKMRGQKTDGYIHLADWYGTFCAIAGVDPTDEKAAKAKLPPVDSYNMWPLISGETDTSPRTDVPVSNVTLISGDYKILIGNVNEAGWTGPQYPNQTNPNGGITAIEHCGDDGCLYNIKDDPEERNNIATKEPEMLKKMQDKLKNYQATYFNPDRGPVSPDACTMALDTYGGFWGPFVS